MTKFCSGRARNATKMKIKGKLLKIFTRKSYADCTSMHIAFRKGRYLKYKRGRALAFMNCTPCYCNKHRGQVLSQLDMGWKCYAPDKEKMLQNDDQMDRTKRQR